MAGFAVTTEVSLLAKAQTPMAPSAPPPTITSSRQSPGIPLAPPDLKLTEPMSQRLIMVRGPMFWGSFKLDRAGVTWSTARTRRVWTSPLLAQKEP